MHENFFVAYEIRERFLHALRARHVWKFAVVIVGTHRQTETDLFEIADGAGIHPFVALGRDDAGNTRSLGQLLVEIEGTNIAQSAGGTQLNERQRQWGFWRQVLRLGRGASAEKLHRVDGLD